MGRLFDPGVSSRVRGWPPTGLWMKEEAPTEVAPGWGRGCPIFGGQCPQPQMATGSILTSRKVWVKKWPGQGSCIQG